ncbi:hypothetical protein PV10_08817 [Exophiala mesophila]|uniref:rRNA-processing protein EFG1 n=1 Tax=Exophiala mesophila TaxID=212818 RepID=A0A0D1ZR15_EXOME|nr:uncharacterized protein PV10_08817 [Exophiala mesophila]KIV89233.1 hypothetical protein PV10_08817 [Exophiala mesophila]
MSLISGSEMEGQHYQSRKRPRDTDDVDGPGDEPRTHKQPKNRSQQNHFQKSSIHAHRISYNPRLSPEKSGITKKKSKSERKKNPSSRIHSLKKQLAKAENMPMTIRQEKERELAALVNEQSKKMVSKAGKKNLQKYHFVRFVERKKAERTLKKLQQQLESIEERDDTAKESLGQSLHEAEVDVNYTKYAPLAEKYISLYADESRDQKREPDSTEASKPPMWYEVEKRMLEGEKSLEALREGKSSSESKSDKDLGTVGRKQGSRENKKKLEDQSEESADADTQMHEADNPAEDDEENSSDGGFFER